MNLVKIGQALSEMKRLKHHIILYMYKAQGYGQITPRRQNFDCKLKVLLLPSYRLFLYNIVITSPGPGAGLTRMQTFRKKMKLKKEP